MGLFGPQQRAGHSLWLNQRNKPIFAILQDGSIQVWDFLDRSNEPFMVVPASAAAVTCLEFWNQASPQLLGVGDAQGILHIMEIPRSLRRPLHKEVSRGGLGSVWSLVGFRWRLVGVGWGFGMY